MIAQEPKQYGTEAGHWYHRDGRPCHQVPYKDKKRKGELKNTTLRDAREMGLVPSVSGILKVMAQPGLTNWIKEQVAEACWDVAIEPGHLNRDGFIQRSLEVAEDNMSKARDLGSIVHAKINQWLSSGVEEDQESPHRRYIEAARNALNDLGVSWDHIASESTFASPLGYGGTIDLIGKDLIADFKCVDSLEKKLDYPDRCAQLCAYRCGEVPGSIAEHMKTRPFGYHSFLSDSRLVNIFISTSEPGGYLIMEWTTEEKDQGWAMFQACFTLWKVISRYDPTAFFPPAFKAP